MPNERVKVSTKESGRRISIWVPEREYWLFDMIEKDVQEREQEGVMSSKGDVVKRILVDYYAKKYK
jgi:hypothetical protein